jgi:hypothetical protein
MTTRVSDVQQDAHPVRRGLCDANELIDVVGAARARIDQGSDTRVENFRRRHRRIARMQVDVDQPRHHQPALGINHFDCRRSGNALLQRHNMSTANRDIQTRVDAAARIQHAAAASVALEKMMAAAAAERQNRRRVIIALLRYCRPIILVRSGV